MATKYIILVVCTVALFQVAAAQKILTTEDEVRIRDARQAVQQINNQIGNNLFGALAGLANASAVAGTNVTRAANVLMQNLLRNTFNLAGVAAYVPRLILLDGPSQFIETLQLVRRNQVRLPSDVDSAIDTVVAFANQQRQSSFDQRVGQPIYTFLPNVFDGVSNFLTTVVDSIFAVIAN